MESVVIKLIFSFIISFLFTYYLVPLFSRLARKLNLLDSPDGALKLQKKPTPYFGGLAVYLGFIATLSLTFPFQNKILLLVLGSTLLIFIGFIDDILPMKPYQKFFWQFLVGFCFLKSGFYLKESFFILNVWSIPISLLWILSIINAFNLIDVMDGLATTVAGCATISFFIIALLLHQPILALLLVSFLGPLCAFFLFNRPIAKIYLGDTGSLFIGGFLATIPFLFKWSTFNPYGFLVPLIILTIPLVEVATLILIRSYKNIPFYNGSPDHFSHYLKHRGWGSYAILGFVAVFSLLLFGLSFLFLFNLVNIIAFIEAYFLLLLIWIFTIWPKFYSIFYSHKNPL